MAAQRQPVVASNLRGPNRTRPACRRTGDASRPPAIGKSNPCGLIVGEAARSIKFRQVSDINQRLWNDASLEAKV
jgi:hypothetical protein